MAFKRFIKRGLKTFHTHKKSKDDIVIVTLPRTGSTLIAEILNVDMESKVCSEPLALNKNNLAVLRKYFDENELSERYTDVSETEIENFKRYFNDLSEGRLWNSFYWSDLFSKYHSFKTKRTIFKTHKLTYIYSKIFTSENIKLIYFLRHPISHSLSRIRNQWSTYNKQFANAKEINPRLTKEQVQLIERIENTGSRLEQFVLSWVFENYHYLELQKDSDRIFLLTYEELVVNPKEVLKVLCIFCNLEFTSNMLDIVQKPSHGVVHSTNETRQEIKLGENFKIISKWRKNISYEEELAAFEILKAFNIDMYCFGEDLPKEKYRIIK